MLSENKKLLAQKIEEIEAAQKGLKDRLFGGKIYENGDETEPITEAEYLVEKRILEAQLLRAKKFPSTKEEICVFCYLREGVTSVLRPVVSSQPLVDRFKCNLCDMEVSVIN